MQLEQEGVRADELDELDELAGWELVVSEDERDQLPRVLRFSVETGWIYLVGDMPLYVSFQENQGLAAGFVPAGYELGPAPLQPGQAGDLEAQRTTAPASSEFTAIKRQHYLRDTDRLLDKLAKIAQAKGVEVQVGPEFRHPGPDASLEQIAGVNDRLRALIQEVQTR